MAGWQRAVAIGGGHGLARTLGALRTLAAHTTAIVTVADDGGSSGRLRRDLDIIPVGDLRRALLALAGDEVLTQIAAHRFARGELAGHPVGNLLLVAALERHDGDVPAALDELAGVFAVPGRVLPCSPSPLTLVANAGGQELRGQARIAKTSGIERVWLEPTAPEANATVLAELRAAEVIVLGPGSLYTSVLPNLLVPEVARAIADHVAPVVLVANLREQPGETQGLTLEDHLAILAAHVPALRLDAVLVHRGPAVRDGTALRWARRTSAAHTTFLERDLTGGGDSHDPPRLAAALVELLGT